MLKFPRIQNLLLLLASYSIIFLMAGTLALNTLLIYTVFIYIISIGIDQGRHPRRWLYTGIALAIINLILWKYFDFFRPHVSQSLQFLHINSSWLTAIILPLGISYYTFQSISYLVSLEKTTHTSTRTPARLGLSTLALHLSFFTTVTAGPIARTHAASHLTDFAGQPVSMREQLSTIQPRHIQAPTLAFILILMALIKNWWLSGWIGEQWVDPVFTNPTQYHSLEILAAIYGYTVQLFLDFSGYSDLMVALGLLLGFRLPINFRAPLLAHNIREFWNRWHISLSTWIRDYIYIPLGGSRKGFGRTQINLIIAMALSGLWHGSGWHFLIWGLLHGTGMACLNMGDAAMRYCCPNKPVTRDYLSQTGWFGRFIAIVCTINFVAFCFVFFRAATFNDAISLLQALWHNTINISLSTNPFYFLLLLAIAWACYPYLSKGMNHLYRHAPTLPRYRLMVPLIMLFLLTLICAPSGIPGFIYAKF